MRLQILVDGQAPPVVAEYVRIAENGGFVSDMRRILGYRPEFLGEPLAALLQYVLRDSPSEWSVGERELIAAFVAGQTQCPF